MSYGSKLCEVERIVYDPSLVLYLPLWKRDGTSIQSDDAYGHTCTVTDATWGVQGRTFNATSSYIEVTHHTAQILTTGGSIEAWIKPNTVGEGSAGTVVQKTTTATGRDGYQLQCIATNRMRFIIDGTGTVIYSATSSVVFGDGNYYHVGVSWDDTGLATFYINGTVSGTPGISADPALITATDNLFVGNNRTEAEKTFDGIIGEVRIYNRVLNPQEIQHNYLSTKWRYQ